MPWVEIPDTPKAEQRRIFAVFGGRAKYLVDESLGVGVYEVIRSRGHNVKFGPDLGLRTDQEVFGRGWREDRVILTHDHDFMNDHEFPFNRNPGIIEMPGASGPPIGLREAVVTVLNVFGHVRRRFEHSKVVITADNVWQVRTWNTTNGRIETDKYWFAGRRIYIWRPG